MSAIVFQSEPFYAIIRLQLYYQRKRHELLFVHLHRQSNFSARGFSFDSDRLRIQTASTFSFARLLYVDSGCVAPNNYWDHYVAVIRSDNLREACTLDWLVSAFSCCYRNGNCYLRYMDCWWMAFEAVNQVLCTQEKIYARHLHPVVSNSVPGYYLLFCS